MTRHMPHPEDESQLNVPKAFKDDLAQLYGSGVPVPPHLDEAILALARQHMARRRRSWMVLRRVGLIGTAAAAAVGLAVLVWKPWHGQGSRPVEPLAARVAPLDPKDIDANGRVDILDAFVLARHLENGLESRADALATASRLVGPEDSAASAKKASGRGEARPSDWDVNGDGVIDNGDVDAVAMAAVSLKGGAS